MDLPEIEKQVLPYLIELAESPPVQANIQAAKTAIIHVIETEAAKAVPFGVRTISRLMRWIYKKLKGDVKFMSGIATITVNDGTNVLEGVTVSYTVSNVACTATTDNTGVATIEGLEAGSYDFTAALSGYTSASITLAITDDATITGTISLTKETTTTEEESTVSTSTTDAITAAAEAAAITSLTTSATTSTGVADGIAAKIKELTAEISTTGSPWVKVRNSIEIAGLTAGLAAITAGLAAELKKLSK